MQNLSPEKMELMDKKVNDSCAIIREAFEKYGAENLRVAWTGGKDSTLVLWLVKKVCDEDGIALPKCFNIDEGDMFPEIVSFVDELVAKWNIDMIHIHNDDVSALANGKLGAEINVADLNESNQREVERLGYEEDTFPYEPESYVGNHLMKTVTMNKYLDEQDAEGFFVGIRWDEQDARADEESFSLREGTEYSPEHWRVHPILHFTERDVWDAHFAYDIPLCSLYNEGYRSLGAKITTTKHEDKPAWEQDLENTYERGGRRQDKEELMVKLRKLGYM